MKRTTWAMVVALGLTAAPALAQTGGMVLQHKQAADEKQVIAEKMKVELDQQLKLSVVGHVTTGAPYSAETINEFVQVLADGNQISRKTLTRVYRDSQGRTRTEGFEQNGTLPGTSISQFITITDPVAGTTYMLYPATHTAVQNGAVLAFKTIDDNVGFATTAPHAVVGQKLEAEKKAAAVAEKAVTAAAAGGEKISFTYSTASGGAAGVYTFVEGSSKNATREDLGEQLVEGVLASGTRTTMVIPVGQIGNAQPIKIVSEEWQSKELGILVMSKHSDPRSGETTYRVTNINRAEPDPSLFQVPADYTVKSSMIKRDSR